MSMLRVGDTVIIWRLDRLARSLKNLIELVEQLEAAKVGLRSLQENINTASSGGTGCTTFSAPSPSSSAA
jgi:DNA invertase Pin-like site-specific DNA recombinase